MNDPFVTRIKFAPLNEYHEAIIADLTDELIETQLHGTWWQEEWIDASRAQNEIDRHWDWRVCEVEFEGRPLSCRKVGIMTTNGELQGGMVISVEGIPSTSGEALLVEWLFTAPRNRPYLRNDGPAGPLRWYTGIGTELLKWGAAFSKERGYHGRLRLDASPAFLAWYEERCFRNLGLPPVEHEGVAYTPMELSAEMADTLLRD